MKTLDRYILKQLVVNFIFGIGLFLSILTASDLIYRLTSLWLKSGLSLVRVVQIFLWNIPSFLVYIIPMAVLLGSILTTSRLSSDSEVVALRAAGVSYFRFTIPFLIFSIWACSATILIQETFVPMSAEKLMQLTEGTSLTGLLFQENTFFREEVGEGVERIFYVRQVNSREGVLSGVTVQEYGKEGILRIISAQEATNQQGKWIFRKGILYEMGPGGEVKRIVRFEREEIGAQQSLQEMLQQQKNPREMSLAQLKGYIERESAHNKDTTRLELILWQKTAIPFASIVFVLLGVSLGVISPRSGKGVGIGVSILVVFGYYVLFSVTGVLAEGGVLDPFTGAWFSNLVGGAVGFVLIFLRERS
ncbi:LptF/LptG family permease [Thermatribacter velox]|uniref:LptF/LptG family permease n=1 Tax=Thermatribacter velox TaxID=3039681 RepID=A0ABZ2YEW7_9BACT